MKRSFDSILFDGNMPDFRAVSMIDEAMKRKFSMYGPGSNEQTESYRTLIFNHHKDEQFISEDLIVSHG